MKTISFKINKINRVWIDATIGDSCPCKIKKCQKTADLIAGEDFMLLVEDVSIRSKYGTDLRYEVISTASKEKCFIDALYNEDLVDRCKCLGGIWDEEAQVWAFDGIVKDRVEELEAIYCSEMVSVEITARIEVFEYNANIKFLGYPLCYATGRDSGAKLCRGISLIEGKISSGGSHKNWLTKISENSKFRLKISKLLLDNGSDIPYFDVKILEEF